ncbi:MAG TPA: hypothetical protein VF017_04850 [Thermoanaerobaculia bacterium]|nr:hypothetical protein [Thermoanaerobaculia bacterium]
MSIRKLFPVLVVVLALVPVSSALAEEVQLVTVSEEEFLSTLEEPAVEGETTLPELGAPAPDMKHGSGCFYSDYVCRNCSGGKLKNCWVQTCYYQGVWHDHYVNCTACSNTCAI